MKPSPKVSYFASLVLRVSPLIAASFLESIDYFLYRRKSSYFGINQLANYLGKTENIDFPLECIAFDAPRLTDVIAILFGPLSFRDGRCSAVPIFHESIDCELLPKLSWGAGTV
jgi:hypothetical protein